MSIPYLTSIPYPVYMTDTLGLNVGLTYAYLKNSTTKYLLQDTLSVAFSPIGYTIRSLAHVYQLPEETLLCNFQAVGYTLRTLVKTYSTPSDIVSLAPAITSGTLNVVVRTVSNFFVDTCGLTCQITAGSLT